MIAGIKRPERIEALNLRSNYLDSPNDEGHTDSIPITHPIIGSNWELSGLRASRIAQLFEKNGFQKDNLTIIGWGETKPVFSNTKSDGSPDLENMAKNRRVVVRIYDRKFSDDPIRQ